MKHKKLFDIAVGTALGTLLGLAVIGCVVTAFDFRVSLWSVGFFCLVMAFVSSLFFVRGWSAVPLLLWVAVTVWTIVDGVFLESAEGFVYSLTQVYSKGYGWPILRWTDVPIEEHIAEIPVILTLLGSLLSLCASWSLCRGQSVTPALLFSCLILGLCFVVTDKVPDTTWVFLVFFAGAMLLIPGALRFYNEQEGRKLTAAILVPVFLCVLLLFAFVPKNGYNGDVRAKAWTKTIVRTLRLDALWEKLTGEVFSDSVNTVGAVDLSLVGKQSYLDTEYLTVKANSYETLYLRSRALDTYDGRSWTNSGEKTYLIWPDEDRLEQLIGEVEISTKYAHAMMYLPYYTVSLDMDDYPAGKENTHKLREYSVACARMPTQQEMLSLYPSAGTNLHEFAVDTGALTALPDSTQRWARQTVEELTAGIESYYHKALAIARYVESSAAYDLKTARMPVGEADFARWFLEESDTGYCIHYATAAAVLLRAAGIPARYVTGYMVQAKAGEAVSVLDSDAHAWVEYWLPAFGWTVLEATPAESAAAPTEPAETEPVETTAPVSQMGGVEPGKPQTQKETADLWWVVILAGVVLLGVFQWRLRVNIFRRRLNAGNTNRQTLARWVALERIGRLLKEAPAEECLELAQKAKYSQYAITEEELAVMDMALETAVKRLKKKNVFLQLYSTVILAIY